MGTEKTRRQKIEWMTHAIQSFYSAKPNETIDKSKLLAEFALQNFSTTRTGAEILKLLETTKRIKIKGGEIHNVGIKVD